MKGKIIMKNPINFIFKIKAERNKGNKKKNKPDP